MKTDKISFTDEEVEFFLKTEEIEKKYKKQFFKCFQEEKKGFPNLWKKVSNFSFLLSIYRENKELKKKGYK